MQVKSYGTAGAGEHALPSAPSGRGMRVLALGLTVLLLGVVVVWTGPRPVSLSAERTGDTALAEALAPHLASHERVTAAFWEGGAEGQVRFAGFGADELDEFHIASVSKTFAGALLMDMVGRGEVRLDATVQDILGEQAAGSPIADVALRELASHTAGITRDVPENPLLGFFGFREVSGSREEFMRFALSSPVSGRGEFAYSNVGINLLAELLATAAGAPYKQLVQERLLTPMGMGSTSFTSADAPERPRIVPGQTATGQFFAKPAASDVAASGYLRSSAADLARWVQSVQSGQNPGAQGLDPIAPSAEGEQIGITWFHAEADDDGTIISHGGNLYGFTSFVGYHRESGRGIVLLSNTGGGLTAAGLAVLNGEANVPAAGGQA